LELVEPVGLAVVLGGEYTGVEEDHHDDEPVEGLGLDRPATDLATATVPLLQSTSDDTDKGSTSHVVDT